MADYPISHKIGEQVNRFDIDEYRWPTVTSEMKDGSRRVRHLTVRPLRSISFEYDAISMGWASTLIGHYYDNGQVTPFNLRIPPRNSTSDTKNYFSTISVRYTAFKQRRMSGIDPFRYPSFRVEFEEVA